ncbi:unnamed protein product [Scytosiphon promiscuus]
MQGIHIYCVIACRRCSATSPGDPKHLPCVENIDASPVYGGLPEGARPIPQHHHIIIRPVQRKVLARTSGVRSWGVSVFGHSLPSTY